MSAERRHILIVEDDTGVATLQRRRLERAGFSAEIAGDTDTALARLVAGGIDLVILDYRLGSTTGLDLHQRMTAAGFTVPVILVSGTLDDDAIIEALRAGVRDVVVKTLDYLDYLPDAVKGVLQQAAATPAAPAPQTGGCVLIVEDDEATATLERRRLERSGYEVTVVGTTEAALAEVRKGQVSLAVLDLRLPGGASGLDLFEQYRAEGHAVPAILVTGFPDQGVAIRAMRAGIRDFVPKSTDFIEYLPTAVSRVLGQIRVERKLVESELRLASIIGTTLDAIVMCDDALRIVLFNPSAEALFRCAATEAMAGTLDRFVVGLTPAGVAATVAGTLRHRVEVDAQAADGTPIPLDLSITDVVINGQRLFTVIARDITERRRIERELREADRRKDAFLGMLAHELRNPLAAIMTAGEVLRRSANDPHSLKLLDVVRRQTRALARMVDDLLDVSRVTLGKIQLNPEPLLLGELVGRAVEGVRGAVETAGLAIETAVDPEPAWLSGDATRLEQVLTNLLVNAVKFTPPGGRIWVHADRDGDVVRIAVRDTGVGIDPALLPRVFDLFVQADTTLAHSSRGLGIGLALVRQLVRLHGGDVTASSAGIGQGSEFVVRLPAAALEMPVLAPPAEIVEPRARLRVLVVDDDTDIADSLAALLGTLGHEARVVYDGAAALDAVRAETPDVMIVDIGMAGLSGYDVARRVRAERQLDATKLVALTGYGRDEDRGRAHEAGFDVHLTKPVADDTLRAVLAELSANASHPRH